MMEYFKPKLNRTTLEGGENPLQVVNLSKLSDDELRTLSELQRKSGTSEKKF